MGYKIIGTTVYLTRGDTMYAEVGIKTKDGYDYVPVQGDSVRFALKSQKMRPNGEFSDETPLILKNIPIDTLILHIEPNDTKNLPFGEYAYDIEISHANGDIDTFIEDAVFKITREVY